MSKTTTKVTSPKQEMRHVASAPVISKTLPSPKRKIQKNEFQEKTSLLDHSEEESLLRTSRLWGFFNLLSMAFVFFFVVSQARQIILEGTLVGMGLIKKMIGRNDLFVGWLLLCSFSFVSVLIQKLAVTRKVSLFIISILHYGLLLFIFVQSIIVMLERDWPFVQTAFYMSEMIVLLMKSHSYLVTNKEFHKKWEEGLQNKSSATEDQDGDPNDKKVRYPQNVTLFNFLMFLIFPTLVYEIQYPRTQKIRWPYFFEKCFSFIGLVSVLHVIVVTYIEPILVNSAKLSVVESIGSLVMPCLVGHLIIFYMIFDLFGNAIGELTYFADREFYSDWWNSTSFDEYARKWNKPVHEWLLRHVYLESFETYKFSQQNATFITFLFSSIIHEFFMALLFRIFRPFLFFFQMFQLPLIYMGRYFKGTRTGNFFFWFGMTLGLPLISVLYSREYYLLLEATDGQ